MIYKMFVYKIFLLIKKKLNQSIFNSFLKIRILSPKLKNLIQVFKNDYINKLIILL